MVMSCSSTKLKDVSSALPEAFQNVSGGNQANPDAVIQIEAAMPAVPLSITIYETKTIDETYALKWAKNFNLDKNPWPYTGGTREVYSYQDDKTTLEVYLNGRLHWYLNNVNQNPAVLPSDAELVPIAEKWLKDNRLYTEGTTKIRTGIHESVGVCVDGQPAVWEPVTALVEFTTGLNGCEFYSGGALVIIGEGGQVNEVTYNMPAMSTYGTAKLKTPQAALDILKTYVTTSSSNSFETRECVANYRNFQNLKITRISLQYTPISGSNYLQPIYVFEGDVYNSGNPNPDNFRGKVDAVLR
jgi:hypothetical protein